MVAGAGKSLRNFEDGVVGLGIVAAMNHNKMEIGGKTARSDPIPILSATGKVKKEYRRANDQVVRMNVDVELWEGYTCVISRVGNNIKDNDDDDDDDNVFVKKLACDRLAGDPGVFFQSSSPGHPPIYPAGDFLSCCYRCRKSLDGLDIFMYRGERGFCSVECRWQQMRSEKQRHGCGSEAFRKSFDCSVSPCSAPFRLYAAA